VQALRIFVWLSRLCPPLLYHPPRRHSEESHCWVLVAYLISIIASSCDPPINLDESKKPTIAFGQGQISFWFPVQNPSRIWKWGVENDNSLEYAWWVQTNILKSKYRFGYSKWKFTSTLAGRGSLEELLHSGQANIWEGGEDGATIIPSPNGVNVLRERNGIEIILTEERLVRAFLNEKPQRVIFIQEGCLLQRLKQEVEVVYPALVPSPLR